MWPATTTQPLGPVSSQGPWNISQTQGAWNTAKRLPHELIIQTRGLTKAYGRRFSIRCMDLDVAKGDIFGFLGPQGAGKTTTIRMLLHLVKPTFGEIKLFGESLEYHASRLLPRVGALVEKPAFQTYLNGFDNLTAISAYTGGVSPRRIEEVLQLVGLQEHKLQRYSTYTPGMRRRLGIASALLTDPELIILDEPTKGLNTTEVAEIRMLLHRLSRLNKTLFISSEDLGEVRQLCTRMGVICAGQLIAQGTVEELLRATTRWEVDVANPEEVRRLMTNVQVVHSVTLENGLVLIDAPTMRGRDLIYYLARNGFWPESVHRREDDLEQLLLRLTRQEQI